MGFMLAMPSILYPAVSSYPQTTALPDLDLRIFLVAPTPSPQNDLTESGSAEAVSVGVDKIDRDAANASSLSWADVNALFESDDDFVRRESEIYIEEAAEAITSTGGWNADRASRQWVASYRLSVFETRRQAQRFFSWGIPDEG